MFALYNTPYSMRTNTLPQVSSVSFGGRGSDDMKLAKIITMGIREVSELSKGEYSFEDLFSRTIQVWLQNDKRYKGLYNAMLKLNRERDQIKLPPKKDFRKTAPEEDTDGELAALVLIGSSKSAKVSGDGLYTLHSDVKSILLLEDRYRDLSNAVDTLEYSRLENLIQRQRATQTQKPNNQSINQILTKIRPPDDIDGILGMVNTSNVE